MSRPHRILYGAAMMLLGAALLLVPVAALWPMGRVAAAPLASVPTTIPEPPTAEPPTAEPPTSVPDRPTAEPPTSVPDRPNDPPDDDEDDPDPTATPMPTATLTATPTATPEPTGEVSITKVADKPSARPGDTVVFTLRAWAVNGPVRDVVVRDMVPPEFEVIDLASSYREVIVEGQTVTAYPSELATSQEVIVTITTRVRPEARAGMVANRGMVTTSTPGDNPGDNTSTTEIEILPPEAAPPEAPPSLPNTADPLLDQAGVWLLLFPTLLGIALMVLGGTVLTNYRLGQRLDLALRPLTFGGPSRLSSEAPAPLGSSPVVPVRMSSPGGGKSEEEEAPPAGRSAPPRLPTGTVGAALPEPGIPRPLPPLVRKQRRPAPDDGPPPKS